MKQNIDLLHSLSESQLKTPTALTSKRVRAFFLYVHMRSKSRKSQQQAPNRENNCHSASKSQVFNTAFQEINSIFVITRK